MKTYRDEDAFDFELQRIAVALNVSGLDDADLIDIANAMGMADDYSVRADVIYFIAEVALGGSWGGANGAPDRRQA